VQSSDARRVADAFASRATGARCGRTLRRSQPVFWTCPSLYVAIPSLLEILRESVGFTGVSDEHILGVRSRDWARNTKEIFLSPMDLPRPAS